eukprot:gene3137-3414_t
MEGAVSCAATVTDAAPGAGACKASAHAAAGRKRALLDDSSSLEPAAWHSQLGLRKLDHTLHSRQANQLKQLTVAGWTAWRPDAHCQHLPVSHRSLESWLLELRAKSAGRGSAKRDLANKAPVMVEWPADAAVPYDPNPWQHSAAALPLLLPWPSICVEEHPGVRGI